MRRATCSSAGLELRIRDPIFSVGCRIGESRHGCDEWLLFRDREPYKLLLEALNDKTANYQTPEGLGFTYKTSKLKKESPHPNDNSPRSRFTGCRISYV